VSSGNRFNIASVLALTFVVGAWLGAESTEVDAEGSLIQKEHSLFAGDSFEQQRRESAPVAWTLFSSNKSLIYPRNGYAAELLQPLRPLYMGNLIEIPEGEEVSILIPDNMTRRHYSGPATLAVIKDTVSVRQGPKVRVFPADPERLKLARSWAVFPVSRIDNHYDSSRLNLIEPKNNSVLLTTNPVFRFSGQLPRDGQLIVFGENGRRFWVQPLDGFEAAFPPAAQFDWGQKFTWEVRKSTGGRVLSGAFEIAPKEVAFELLQARVPNVPDVTKEDLIFYGVKLELARAYKEAQVVWEQVGASPYK
jgi:hypothetical protein